MAHGQVKSFVLKLKKIIYGQKQVMRVRNRHLYQTLIDIGFGQSKYDKCLYNQICLMFAVYVDNGIFVSPDDNKISKYISATGSTMS